MTLREYLGAAKPRFPLKGAWNRAIRALRAWGRRSARKPRLGRRSEVDRLLDLPGSPEVAAHLKSALKALLDAPESDEAAARLDALAVELLPRVVRGLVPVHVDDLPAQFGERDYRRLTGLPSWNAIVDPMTAAVLQRRLHGEVLGGRTLNVRVMLPGDAQLPTVPRSLRANPTPRNRDAPWVPDLDEEGRWSLTPLPIARRQADAAMGSVVIDVGCGCGGNTIAFAEAGFRVIAIEPDPGRRTLAAQNIHRRGLDESVELLDGTAADRLPELLNRDSHAAVFIDPPWGGPDWTRRAIAWDELISPLGVDTPLLRSGAQLLVKAPRTFDVATLPGDEGWGITYEFGSHEDDRRVVKCITASAWSPAARSFDSIV